MRDYSKGINGVWALLSLVIIMAFVLLIFSLKPPADFDETSTNQELCTQMGKVMETERAVAVGSMCCTEYTCLEIKQ